MPNVDVKVSRYARWERMRGCWEEHLVVVGGVLPDNIVSVWGRKRKSGGEGKLAATYRHPAPSPGKSRPGLQCIKCLHGASPK